MALSPIPPPQRRGCNAFSRDVLAFKLELGDEAMNGRQLYASWEADFYMEKLEKPDHADRHECCSTAGACKEGQESVQLILHVDSSLMQCQQCHETVR